MEAAPFIPISDQLAAYYATAGGAGTVTNKTYTEIVAMQAALTLVPGALYRMTDYQTLHKIPGVADRNDTNTVIPVEVLVLRAKSTSAFETQVYSESFPDDIIHYTTDNTAWKDLAIAGQKGCITKRIDPKANIEVGEGDWRNFIVRRWAADLSAYGRGTRWVLWAASTNCGVTTAGATQTFVAMNANVYHAIDNPTGYKDVRLFLPTSGARGVANVYMKASVDNYTTFNMPNFHIETTGVNTNILNNVFINNVKNVTVTNEMYEISVQKLRATIVTDTGFSFVPGSVGYFEGCFIAMNLFDVGNIGNLNIVTIWDESTIQGSVGGATFFNLSTVYLKLLNSVVNPTTAKAGAGIQVTNSRQGTFTIQKGNGVVFRVNGCSFRAIVDDNFLPANKLFTSFTTNVIYDFAFASNISITKAAAVNIALSTSDNTTDLDMFAGIINLTGAGTVDIDTITRYLPNNFPVILKPEAGLIININRNNVANGFAQAGQVTANGTNGDQIVLFPSGDRWLAMYNVDYSLNNTWTGTNNFNERVQVGAGAAAITAIMQIDSTTRGFLPPRMTTAQRTGIAAPAEGLHVWDTDLKTGFYFDGTNWVAY